MLGGSAVAVAGLLAALALVYSNASGVAAVAEHARTQQMAESALGATAAARNTLGQVLILAAAEVGDPDTLTRWIEEADLMLADLTRRVDDVAATAAGADADVLPALANAVDLTRQTLDLVAAGDTNAAGTLAGDRTGAAYDELTGRLVVVRDTTARAIAAARLEASDVATASRFMVAFFVPALATVGGSIALRRRRRRERLADDLTRERAISRSKDQLIANLSHELRTPLTGIYTSALAIDELGDHDPATARELNGMIIDQSADLTRMVEDLLVGAQADAGRLTFSLAAIPVHPEVDAVVREFSRLGTAIAVDVTDEMIHADAGRLRQILRNLVSNAVRHGGPAVSIVGRCHGATYLLAVADDGPGIPVEIEPKLFERFIHEGDRPLIMGSVGLGLAITRVLVEGMGGRIRYERRNGLTIFALALRMTGSEVGRSDQPDHSDLPDRPHPLRAGHAA